MVEDYQKLKKENKKLKEKKNKSKIKKIEKVFNKKVTSRRILKKDNVTYHQTIQPVSSILGESNQFFNKTYEQDKRNFFLQ